MARAILAFSFDQEWYDGSLNIRYQLNGIKKKYDDICILDAPARKAWRKYQNYKKYTNTNQSNNEKILNSYKNLALSLSQKTWQSKYYFSNTLFRICYEYATD